MIRRIQIDKYVFHLSQIPFGLRQGIYDAFRQMHKTGNISETTVALMLMVATAVKDVEGIDWQLNFSEQGNLTIGSINKLWNEIGAEVRQNLAYVLFELSMDDCAIEFTDQDKEPLNGVMDLGAYNEISNALN